MKKSFWIIVLCLVFSMLIGCTCQPDTYPFVNQNDSIICVELLYHPQPSNLYTTKDYLLIRELEKDEIIPFIDSLHELKTDKCITPPPRGYGEYVVRVIYMNGDVEIFGNYHIEFVKNGDEEAGVGLYVFNPYIEYIELFLTYSGSQDFLDETWFG